MIYIGIDPGKNGAIALIRKSAPYSPEFINLKDATLPDVVNWMDVKVCSEGDPNGCAAVIERVSSSPQMGVSSAFTFGESYGQLQALLTCLKVPFKRETPQKWQRAMAIPKRKKTESQTEHKRKLKRKAQELYPHTKITNKNADAILIARYCMDTLQVES